MSTLVNKHAVTVPMAGPRSGGGAAVSQAWFRHEVQAVQRPVPLGTEASHAGSACDQLTVPAPLALQSPAAACADAAAWVEAWLPQAAFTQVQRGQPARITLSRAGFAAYGGIDGTVTGILSGSCPGVIGSQRFCRVRIRPLGAFFVGGHTYHPLLPGVPIRVALQAAGATLMALLAAVRSRPT